MEATTQSARPYRDAKCRRLIAEQGFDINDNDYTSTDFADLAFIKVEKALG